MKIMVIKKLSLNFSGLQWQTRCLWNLTSGFSWVDQYFNRWKMVTSTCSVYQWSCRWMNVVNGIIAWYFSSFNLELSGKVNNLFTLFMKKGCLTSFFDFNIPKTNFVEWETEILSWNTRYRLILTKEMSVDKLFFILPAVLEIWKL